MLSSVWLMNVKDFVLVRRFLAEFSRLLLELWRKKHPKGHERTYIDFNVRKPPAQSVPLNFEPAKKDGATYGHATTIQSRPVEHQSRDRG